MIKTSNCDGGGGSIFNPALFLLCIACLVAGMDVMHAHANLELSAVGHVTNHSSVSLLDARDVDLFTVGSTTYAAVAAFKDGIQILKLTNDAGTALLDNPELAGNIRRGGSTAVDVFTVDSTMYAATTLPTSDGVQIYKLTNDAGTALLDNPELAGKIVEELGTRDLLNLDHAYDIHTFTVGSATYAAVVADHDDGIQILKLTNDAGDTLLDNPEDAGKIDDTTELALYLPTSIDIFAVGSVTYAAVAARGDHGIQILKLINDTGTGLLDNPMGAGNLTDTGQLELNGAFDVDIFNVDSTTYAAVAARGDHGIQILKLTNDAGTALLDSPEDAGKITDTPQLRLKAPLAVHIFTVDSITYAATSATDGEYGVQILKLTNDTGTGLLDNPEGVVNVATSDQLSIRVVNSIDTLTIGSVTYAAAINTGGIQILKLTNDTGTGLLDNPEGAGRIDDRSHFLLHSTWDVDTFAVGSVTYAAVTSLGEHGVQILKLTNDAGTAMLATPIDAGNIADTTQLELDDPHHLDIFTVGSATYAAVAAYTDDGVQILQLTNDAGDTLLDNPTDAGKIRNTTQLELNGAFDVHTFTVGSVTYAAVASQFENGVQILKLTNDAGTALLDNPEGAGEITDGGSRELRYARSVHTFTVGSATYAAVAAYTDDGVQILQLTNDAGDTLLDNPTDAGKIRNAAQLELNGPRHLDIFTVGSATYAAVVANFDNAVQILKLTNDAGDTLLDNPEGAGKITDTEQLELDGVFNIHIFIFNSATYAAVASLSDDGVQILQLTNDAGDTLLDNPEDAGKLADTDQLYLEGARTAHVFAVDSRLYTAVTSAQIDSVQIFRVVTPSIPTISSTAGASGSTTGTTPVPFSISFDETVTGFTSSDITVGGTSTPGAVTGFTGSGAGPYTFSITPGRNGTITIDIAADVTDTGNVAAATFAITYSTLPIPTISSTAGASGSTTGTTPVPFSVSFNKAVTGFTSSDITVGGTSTPGVVTGFTGSGAGPYTFTVAPAQTGTVLIGIQAGVTTPGNIAATTFSIRYSSLVDPATSAHTNLDVIDAGKITDTPQLRLNGAQNIDIFTVGSVTYAAVAALNENAVQILQLTNDAGDTLLDNPEDAGKIADTAQLVLSTASGIDAFSVGSATYAAVTAWFENAVQILQLTNDTSGTLLDNPIGAGRIFKSGPQELAGAWDVTTFTVGSATYAAVAAFADDGVQILQLTNDTGTGLLDNPEDAGKITDTAQLELDAVTDVDIFTVGSVTYAAVAANADDGVQILQLTNDTGTGLLDNPEDAGKITDTAQLELDGAWGVTTFTVGSATYAAVAANADDGIQILQLTNDAGTVMLANPINVGNLIDTPQLSLDGAYDIGTFTVGSATYAAVAANADDGIQILQLSNNAGTAMFAYPIDAGKITDTAQLELDGSYNLDIFTVGSATYAAVAANTDHGVQIVEMTLSRPVPTISSTAGASGSTTGTTPVPFSVSFDKAVTGFTSSDITVGGTSTPGAVTSFTGSGAGPYTFSITPGSDGTITIGIAAGVTTPSSTILGNAAASTFTITYSSLPIPAISSTAGTSGSTTGTTPIPFSISFDKAVTGFTSSDITVGGTSTPGAVTSFTGSGAGPYTFSITPGSDGTITIGVSANVATVSGGTLGNAAASTFTIAYSALPVPTITSGAGSSGSTTGTTPVPFSVSFSKSVTGFNATDITIGGTSTPGAVTGFTGSGSGPYTFTVAPGSDGTITVDIAADVTTPSGTTLGNAAATTFSITYSSLPVPTISSTAGSSGATTGTTPVPFSISFDKAVNGFTSSDITVGGTSTPGAVTGFTGSGAGPYTFSVTPGSDGTITIGIAANVATVSGGTLGNSAATTFSITYSSLPVPTISSTAGTSGSTTGTTPVPFSVSFSKSVTGFNATDITIGGTSNPGAVTGFAGSGSGPYTFTITPGSDGTITIDIAADVTTPSGTTLGNAAATTFSITYSSLPLPTISSTAGTSGAITGTTPVPFSISFDKAVTGFTSSDITVGGTSTPGAVTSFAGSGAGPYTFSITPGSDGTITIGIAANTATVSGGTLGNSAATTFSITYSSLPVPTISSTAGASGSTTETSPVPFSISFSKAVSGFTSSDITVGGTSTPGAVTGFTGSGSGPYTFSVTPGSEGTITLGIAANVTTPSGTTLGNAAATTFTITYSTLPMPTISSNAGTSGSTIDVSPIPFSISFDKAVTGFTSSDITVGGTSTPGAVTGFAGSGSGPYTFTITPGSDGTITIDIAAGVTTPSGTILGNAAATTFTITYSSPPAPTISSSAGATGSSTMTAPVPFSISFDKTVSGFTSSDITVGGTSNPGAVTGFAGSGSGPYTFTITPAERGTITITVPAGVASPANASATFTITYSTDPFPTITSLAGSSGSTTYDTPVPFSISFDRAVTGFTASDITVAGTANPGAITGFAGSGAGPYTFNVTPGSDGTIVLTVPDSVTVPPNAASTFTITYYVPSIPTITSSAGLPGSVTYDSPVPFSISFDKVVTGFEASDIMVQGSANPGPVTDFAGSGAGPYTFNVMPGNDGEITLSLPISVVAPANAQATFSIRYAAPPIPTITSSAGMENDVVVATPVPFSISFDKPVTGFTASDVTVSGSSGPGSVTGFAGSGAGPYTFNVTPVSDGSLVVSVPANAALPANAAGVFHVTYDYVVAASDWSAKLNVRELVAGLHFGCDDTHSIASFHCAASLTESEFELDGIRYGITQVYVDTYDSDTTDASPEGTFHFTLDPAPGPSLAGYLLSVDTSQFAFACGTMPQDTCNMTWRSINHFLNWRTDTDTATPFIPDSRTITMSLDERTVRQTTPPTTDRPTTDRPITANPVTWSTDWSPTLTVKNLDGHIRGCDNANPNASKHCSAALTRGSFELAGTTYVVSSIHYNPTEQRSKHGLPANGTLYLGLDPQAGTEFEDYTLHVGGLKLNFGSSVLGQGPSGEAVWDGVSNALNHWNGAADTRVKISLSDKY